MKKFLHTKFNDFVNESNFTNTDIIKTPEFKAWFKNSKVVDKRGNPIVVYHGSPDLRGLKSENIFKTSNQRFDLPDEHPAFYFTDNYSKAKSYADPKRAFDYQNAEEGIIPVYLSLQNPLIIYAEGAIWRKFEIEIDGQLLRGTRKVVEFAHEHNYDGVIVKNVKDNYNNNENAKTGNVYTAFYPEQIKIANGKNTTFNPNSKSILENNLNKNE